MRPIPRRLTFSFLLALLWCAPALAQEKHMQLLTPDVGWVLRGGELYWTTDRGGHWTKITPPMSMPREEIADVFFKDTTDGWALLSSLDDAAVEARFELATTIYAGATWAITPVEIPGLNPNQTILTGGGRVHFLNSGHGYLNLDVGSSSNFRLV